MEVIDENNLEIWNNWAQNNGASFLQSYEWGEILRAEGKEVERLAVVENGDTVAEAQVVYYKLPLGMKYGFCPAGPVLKCRMSNDEFRINDQIYKCLNDYLKSRDCIFFRFESPYKLQATSYKLSKTIDITPRATSVLDITKPEAELLAGFEKKTRYSLRQAEQKGVKIDEEKDLDLFYNLLKETAARNKFTPHPREHYRAILGSANSRQLNARVDGIPIAAAIFFGFPAKDGSAYGGGDSIFTYLFAASSGAQREFMAPYLIQWEAIKMAKKLGYKFYDFFGIAPNCHPEQSEGSSSPKVQTDPSAKPQDDKYEYDPKHRYAGVTKFKLGFGGTVREGPGTFDMVLSPVKYRVYLIMRFMRRLIH